MKKKFKNYNYINKKRVLRITILDIDDIKNPLLNGGQAKTTLEIGKRLVSRGYRVDVISSKYPGSRTRKYKGIAYRHIGIGTNNIRVNNAIYILCIPFVVSRIKADLIIECFTPPISTLLTPLWTRIPVIALPSSFDAERFSRLYHLPFSLIEKFGCQFYKYFLPFEKNFDEKMNKLNPNIISKIVPEGVEKNFFSIKRKNPQHILFVGRYDMNQKGIDLLLQAYSIIKNKIPFKLLLVGAGPDRERIRQLILKFELSDKVKMINPTYGVKKRSLLSSALFVALPSRYESFSLFALEALASGSPLVAFDIPGISWIDKEVILKSKRFDVNLYADLLLKLSSDMSVIEDMSTKARIFAHKFTWNKVVDEYESFFKHVLSCERSTSNQPVKQFFLQKI